MSDSIRDTKSLADEIVVKAIAQPTEEERAREERLAELMTNRIMANTEVVPEMYSLSVDGVGFFALNDLHAVKGKQKSGKSAVLKVCAAALLSGQQFRVKSELREPMVMLVDTEQQAADVKLVIDEVKAMTGRDDEFIDNHLMVYTLRRMSYDTLLDDTRLLIGKHRPQVVLVDGLVDYIASFNDEVLSRELIHQLLVLCEEYKCAIVNVLHENKASDDENMRGHLGTVLSQKAGTVLQCRRGKDGTIHVSCPDARHGTMPSWNVRFNPEGHLEDADRKYQEDLARQREERRAKQQAKKDAMLRERLQAALEVVNANGGYCLRKDLTSRLTDKLHLSRPVVSRFISQMVTDEKLFESEKYITATRETPIPFF